MEHKVLIVTGSLVSYQDKSLFQIIKKQIDSLKFSSGAWQDIQQKISASKNLLGQKKYRKTSKYQKSAYHQTIENYFGNHHNVITPQLTEVSIATLLTDEGVNFGVTTFSEIYGNRKLRNRLLKEHDCIFISTSLIRDLSELMPLLNLLKTKDNKIVLGGALTGALHHSFMGLAQVDILAVGYGEYLVASLAKWINSDYQEITPPPFGRVIKKEHGVILYSGVPNTRNLDDLRLPDWSIAEKIHQQKFAMVHYESVRGCPYRCSFCNYPYLFDDKVFRFRSAEQIAKDWEHYASQGAKYITCLDSLFTIPRKRLVDLCESLIAKKLDLKWICYARADDLSDLEICKIMRQAGCIQVHIGIESGNQQQLDNMNKRCTVANNQMAILNCQEVGINSFISVIIGFPGETTESVEETFDFLALTKPDMYYAALFSTRIENVPILSKENRERFGLDTMSGSSSSAPYWKHETMNSVRACQLLEEFNDKMIANKVSLEASLFYQGFLGYDRREREMLLEYQQDLAQHEHLLKPLINKCNHWATNRLAKAHALAFSNQQKSLLTRLEHV